MSFAWPLVLIALVAVPLLAALYVWRERRRRREAARWGNPALLPNIVDREPGRLRHLPVAVALTALAALIVGVARPHATVRVSREDATVVIVIDTSRSMGARDIRPSRLAAARLAALDFAKQVPSKFRISLVTFGSRAVVALPPTTDRSLVPQVLQNLRPGQGTALGDAIALAVRIGRKERSSDGTIPPESVLVISDGAAEGGLTTVDQAIARARSVHVPVSAIVLGTPAGYVQAKLPTGQTVTIQVPPSPATLRHVAAATGGQFGTAATDTNLRAVYEQLASHLGTRKTSRELGDAFAAGSLVLLLLGGGASALWFRRVV